VDKTILPVDLKPVDCAEFLDTSKVLGLYWLMVKQPLPERIGE